MPRFKEGEICKLGKGKFRKGKTGDKVSILEVWKKNKKTLEQKYVILTEDKEEYVIDERYLEKYYKEAKDEQIQK